MTQPMSSVFEFTLLLIQVFLVGMLVGGLRVILPAIAESEYKLFLSSPILISTIVLAFGFGKAVFNLVAGFLTTSFSYKRILIYGWFVGIPVPFIIAYSSSWVGVSVALTLLGVNQGLNWSITQAAKVQIIKKEHRGHAMGMNEFFGYVGVAFAGVITANLVESFTSKNVLMTFSLVIIFLGLLCTIKMHEKFDSSGSLSKEADIKPMVHSLSSIGHKFLVVSWQNKRLMALCQAGFVEKFIDALVWLFFPIYFLYEGLSIVEVSWVVSCYSFAWGGLQFVTGRLSDVFGRVPLITAGMLISGVGILLILVYSGLIWWGCCSLITGLGMALLYPNLSAAVADEVHLVDTSITLGIYRFWRDLGYAGATLAFAVASYLNPSITMKFIIVSLCMLGSTVLLIKNMRSESKTSARSF